MMQTTIKDQSEKAEKVWSEAYDIIWKIIKKNKYKIGAEVGVAFGGHSERILDKTTTKLYCIDPYKNFKNYQDGMNLPQKEFDKIYDFVKIRFKKYGSKCEIIRKTSREASKILKSKLDFVYIDADHSYEGVLSDIGLWFPKVRDGGILSGHDYNHPNHMGVKKAVDEYFKRFGWKINTHKSGVWWVEKKSLNVSFIMPAYNAEETIKESIDSIFNGNFSEGDELIIVNDRSTDGTKDIIEKLKLKYKYIKIITHRSNRGGGEARNTAVKHANNPIIYCLDSDNILISKSISKLKKFLIEKNADAACFKEIKFFTDKINKITHAWKFEKSEYIFSDYFSTHIVPGASGNYMFTKKSFIASGGYPKVMFQDTWGFGLRQSAENQKMLVMPKSHYFHRVGHESNWIRHNNKHNISLNALSIIKPYLGKIFFLDRIYIQTIGRKRWFSNIPNKPIRTKQ